MFRRSTAVRDLWIGQLGFWAGVVVCIALRPDGLGANDGISYFGGLRDTLIPYLIAFGMGAGSMAKAAGEIPGEQLPARITKLALAVFAILMLGIVLVPRTLFEPAHISLGAALFAGQFGLCYYLYRRVVHDRLSALLLGVLWLGGIISAVELIPKTGMLIQGQLVFQAGFGLLMIRGVGALTAPQGLPAATAKEA